MAEKVHVLCNRLLASRCVSDLSDLSYEIYARGEAEGLYREMSSGCIRDTHQEAIKTVQTSDYSTVDRHV